MTQRRCRRTTFALALVLFTLGCGSDDDDDEPPGSGGDCPNLAGTWTITMHCGTSLIGTRVMIEQTGCAISTEGSFAGLSGGVGADGSFTLRGTQNGTFVSCGGVATSKSITETCDEGCVVTLAR